MTGPDLRGKGEIINTGSIGLVDIFRELGVKMPSDETMRMIDRLYGDPRAFLSTNVREMCDRFGFSQPDAVALSLCATLPDYLNSIMPEEETENILTTAKVYFKRMLGGKRFEEVWIRCFDEKNKVLLTEKLGEGMVDEVQISQRTILEKAVSVDAKRVVIAHNHPVGKVIPSSQDIMFTDFCFNLLKRWKINLLDHFIVGSDEIYSFADNGHLESCDQSTLLSPKKRKREK